MVVQGRTCNTRLALCVLWLCAATGLVFFHIITSWPGGGYGSLWELQLTAEFEAHLQQLSTIPRKVHVAWNDTTVMGKDILIVEYGLRALATINPTWDVRVYDDQAIDRYIRDHIPAADYDMLQHAHMVEKVDLWRLLVIYHEGGLYADIDRLCNQDLETVMRPHTRMLLPTWRDQDFSQDLMCSAPQNRVFEHAIRVNLEGRRSMQQGSRPRDIYELGPRAYFRAVFEVLFGRRVSGPPKFGFLNFFWMQYVRWTISSNVNMVTYREFPPGDTLLWHGPIPANVTRSKATLQLLANAKQWNR